jgi:glutathione S-transferase
MKLYGASQSPFVRKVRVVLEEKGIPYETEPIVPIPKTPELLALHPLGKIPILRDGALVVPDSSVICAYLEKRYPSPPLYPEDPAELARALFLEEYADTQLAEGMGAIVLERFVKPNLLKQPTDEKRLAELMRAMTTRWFGEPPCPPGLQTTPVMEVLESVLPADRDSVLARFGIADAALGAHLGWLAAAGVELDAERWPRTARYYRALVARPSFKTVLAQ